MYRPINPRLTIQLVCVCLGVCLGVNRSVFGMLFSNCDSVWYTQSLGPTEKKKLFGTHNLSEV